MKVDSVIHCFQSCFCLNFREQKRETQFEMFFPGNNSLLTWLGNNYTNPLLEAGVFSMLCMIHSRRDFYFLLIWFHMLWYFFPVFFFIIIFISLSRQVQNLITRKAARGRGSKLKEQSGYWGSRCKRIKKSHYLESLWHPANHSNNKVCIIRRICTPRETAWNLIAIGYIHSMTPDMKRLPV